MKNVFTFKNLCISIFGALFLTGICKLGLIFGTITAIMIFLLVPGIIKYMEREKKSYQRFTDACIYMEQMEGSYRQKRNIYEALVETEELFKEGDMKEILKRAIMEFEMEDAGADAAKNALHIIEESYGCEQMELFHDFILKNSVQGGDCETPIELIEKRRIAWMDATEKCRDEKKRLLTSVMLSFIVYFIISEVIVFFLPKDMAIITLPLERGLVVCNVLILLVLAKLALKKNSTDWLESNPQRDVEKIERDYMTIEHYDLKKERITSLKWSILPMAVTCFAYVATRSLISFAIGLPIVFLFLNQHMLNRYLTEKRLKREIERDYPKWLLSVILFMQKENVQGAISKSIENAPNVLKHPLAQFMQTIQENPSDSDAYFQFLQEHDVPKVHESMKILFSISKGLGGNQEKQMYQIIDKNNAMTMRSEEIKNDNRIAGIMGFLFYPVVPTAIKMVADLLLIMLTMYGNMGNIF